MRCIGLLAALAAAFLLSGCNVRSLYPLYTERDVIFDPGLLGFWQQADDDDHAWVCLRDKENSYRVVSATDGFTFDGRLLRLGAHLYLDLTLVDTPFQEFGMIPGHLFLQIELSADRMRTAMLDEAKLRNLEGSGGLKLGHMTADVLTALPKELQAFVTQHADDGIAFIPFNEFVRIDPMR